MNNANHIEPYKHDCERCIWVGWIYIKGGGKWGSDWGNMYFCPSNPEHRDVTKYPGSVVIRFSDEPSDYWSNAVGITTKGPIGLGSHSTQKHVAVGLKSDAEEE